MLIVIKRHLWLWLLIKSAVKNTEYCKLTMFCEHNLSYIILSTYQGFLILFYTPSSISTHSMYFKTFVFTAILIFTLYIQFRRWGDFTRTNRCVWTHVVESLPRQCVLATSWDWNTARRSFIGKFTFFIYRRCFTQKSVCKPFQSNESLKCSK